MAVNERHVTLPTFCYLDLAHAMKYDLARGAWSSRS